MFVWHRSARSLQTPTPVSAGLRYFFTIHTHTPTSRYPAQTTSSPAKLLSLHTNAAPRVTVAVAKYLLVHYTLILGSTCTTGTTGTEVSFSHIVWYNTGPKGRKYTSSGKLAPLPPPAPLEVEPHLDQHQLDGSKTIGPTTATSVHKLALRAAVKTASKLYTRSRCEALRAAHHAFSGQYGILTESKSGLHDIQMIQ